MVCQVKTQEAESKLSRLFEVFVFLFLFATLENVHNVQKADSDC